MLNVNEKKKKRKVIKKVRAPHSYDKFENTFFIKTLAPFVKIVQSFVSNFLYFATVRREQKATNLTNTGADPGISREVPTPKEGC